MYSALDLIPSTEKKKKPCLEIQNLLKEFMQLTAGGVAQW
jgi:hypothetical protein